MASSKRKFETVGRMIAKKYRQPAKSLSTAIGELVWASNFAQGSFCLLFTHIVSPSDAAIGDEIWKALLKDSAQRDALLAASNAASKPAMRSRVKWLHKMAGKLSAIRNDAVHTPIMFSTSSGGEITFEPFPISIADARHKRVTAYPDLKKTFRTARGDYVQLAFYAHALSQTFSDENAPWPRRPRLRSNLRHL